MSYKGIVVNWNDSKGFGFIKPEGNKKEIFAHISDFKSRIPRSITGEEVRFNVSKDDKGRVCAVNVRVNKSQGKSSLFSIYYIPIAVLIATIGFPIYKQEYPIEVAYWIGIISIITILYYARDKAKAQSNSWRISEDKLHLFSLLGGWPGAIIAQQVYRHKTAKKSFQRVFWATVIINCGLVAWSFTREGAPYMYEVIFSVKYYLSRFSYELTPIINDLINK